MASSKYLTLYDLSRGEQFNLSVVVLFVGSRIAPRQGFLPRFSIYFVLSFVDW